MPEYIQSKDKIMEDYLSSLLTEVSSEPEVELNTDNKTLNRLLNSDEIQELTTAKSRGSLQTDSGNLESTQDSVNVDSKVSQNDVEEAPESHIILTDFQALFFDVAGLTLAVPLTELGGIHKIDKIGPLFGKPTWFKGVMLHKERKLNVVDTAEWVMPNNINEKLSDSLKYKYLVMLKESSWGLACEELVSTSTLKTDDVKWRTSVGKRPWLAGTVKEKMCALLNVNQLINLLDKGQGSNEH